jgi:hypothetical protein
VSYDGIYRSRGDAFFAASPSSSSLDSTRLDSTRFHSIRFDHFAASSIVTSTRLRFRPDFDFDFDFDFDALSLFVLLELFERSLGLGDPRPRSPPPPAPAPVRSLLSAAIRRSVSSVTFTAALARSRASFFSSSRLVASSSVDVSVLELELDDELVASCALSAPRRGCASATACVGEAIGQSNVSPVKRRKGSKRVKSDDGKRP